MLINRLINKHRPIIKEFYVLGTIIQLKVYGKNGELAIAEAIDRLNDIDDKMSVFKDCSDVSRINENAGGLPQQVGKDTYFVMKKAVEYAKLSGGAFDPTIRPVVNSWGIGTKHEAIPDKVELKNKLELVKFNDITFNEQDTTIKLNYKEQAIDVGGIAKGYAADEVRNIFMKNKIKSAIIDLGGNIFALGRKNDGTLWNIGIQDPLNTRMEYVGVLNVKNKSVVTSGNYERFFMREDKKIHHIMDPRTGYPSDNGVISATIISEDSIDGDALSTCAYVMGLQEGIKLIEAIEGVDAIFITKDKKIHITSGIKENFKLSNNNYIKQGC